jgi:hypothetical protein
MWQPRYLNEGEEGLEILDVKAVMDNLGVLLVYLLILGYKTY